MNEFLSTGRFTNLHADFLLTGIVLAILGGIVLLFLCMMVRRTIRHFRIRRFDVLSLKIHKQWREMVRGDIPFEEWRRDSIQCEIVQSIVIQEISAATDKDRAGLQEFLRSSGLIDLCIRKVHDGHGWTPPPRNAGARCDARTGGDRATFGGARRLAVHTRMAAVQSLGRTGLAEAGEPIIESFMVGALKVPSDPIANALVCCFVDHREALLPYLRRSQGESRELLARVASELATPAMADEMILLAADPGPKFARPRRKLWRLLR